MRVSYLELRNYRRFREAKVQFPDGIVGILGVNGSGKSTLIEGIAWALFGNTDEVVRTSRESIRRAGVPSSESCFAALEFELDGAEYRIEREMGGKGLMTKAHLRSGDRLLAEGDRPVRGAVEKLIGMDHKSFFTSVFARQKELNALQNIAAGERKKAVLRMLRIDGVDAVLQEIRTDKRDTSERIKGALSTLLDEDGRDREAVLKDRLPELDKVADEAKVLLRAAEEEETAARKDLEETTARRDQLRKDFDAYTTAAKDLSAKRSALGELRTREERLAKRIAEAKAMLSRLPELEKAEKSWSGVTEELDRLEQERQKDQRRAHLTSEVEEEERERDRLRREREEQEAARKGLPDIGEQKIALDRARSESEEQRATILARTGESRARSAQRQEAAEKDRAKLEEIRGAGKEGVCPTCERALGDAYDLLIGKLRDAAELAEEEASKAKEETQKLEAELKGASRKDEALRKKALWLEQESDKRRRLEARAEGLASQLDALGKRIDSRRRELATLGRVEFSAERYQKAKKDRDRLRPLHDDFVRLKGTEDELRRNSAELGEVEESISKNRLEEQGLADLVRTLEPKKALYDSMVRRVDQTMNSLAKAKDESRRRANTLDSAVSTLNGARRDLETIARVKAGIEAERKKVDDLGLLEDIVVSFRDYLIGKVSPTLAELTSHVVDLMTEGKYSRVELDEAYEIQLDDQGTLHPLSRFSGGEADLANLALRLAISRVVAERTGATPINFLILDEIFGSLDPGRKRSVMTALSGLSSQFRQIFLITHIEDVKDLMGYVIKVEEREDGTSEAILLS